MILALLLACGVTPPDADCSGWTDAPVTFTGTLEGDLSGTIELTRWAAGNDTGGYDGGLEYFSGWFKPEQAEPYEWAEFENLQATSICGSGQISGDVDRGWSDEDYGYIGRITGTINESGGEGEYTVDHMDGKKDEVTTWTERFSGSWSVSP